MKTSLKALGVAVALAFSAGANAGLLIDSFNTDQATIIDTTIGGPTITSESGFIADVLGGYRELIVSKDAGSNPSAALVSSIGVAGGYLNFSNNSLVTGTGTVIWDGLMSAGLGGIDLTTYGNAFVFDVIAADGSYSFTLTAASTSGTSSKTISGAAGPATLSMSFGDLVGTADLTDLDSLKLVMTGATALDVSIDTIDVPEPGSLALVGLGLLGLGALRRRQA